MDYWIVAAEALPDYRLWLRFKDGTEGDVSVAHLVGQGVFAAWDDESVFRSVTVDPDSGTVTWPGELDLAPDALYRRITETASAARVR